MDIDDDTSKMGYRRATIRSIIDPSSIALLGHYHILSLSNAHPQQTRLLTFSLHLAQ